MALTTALPLWAQAPSDRRSPALDALAMGPLPTAEGENRTGAHFDLVQFGDVFGLKAEGLVHFGTLELRARGFEQVLTGYTEEGTALDAAYSSRRHWLGVEIASHFVSSRGESGRLALEFLRTMPSGENYVKLSLQTALVGGVDKPWRFWLETAYYFPLQKKIGDTLSVRLSIDRRTEFGWRFGGAFGLTYRLGPVADPGLYEIAMISIGPTVRIGGFSAGANFRVLLDKRVVLNQPESSVSGLRPPDVYLGWDLR